MVTATTDPDQDQEETRHEILLQDGLARRLAPAEMDHPDGEHSD
jgi:hypothetical protein